MHGFELSPPAGEAIRQCRYDDPIFVVPPWETIFDEDTERRHTFGEAVAEYGFLLKAFTEFGYKVCVVPQMANESRVKFILTELGIS